MCAPARKRTSIIQPERRPDKVSTTKVKPKEVAKKTPSSSTISGKPESKKSEIHHTPIPMDVSRVEDKSLVHPTDMDMEVEKPLPQCPKRTLMKMKKDLPSESQFKDKDKDSPTVSPALETPTEAAEKITTAAVCPPVSPVTPDAMKKGVVLMHKLTDAEVKSQTSSSGKKDVKVTQTTAKEGKGKDEPKPKPKPKDSNPLAAKMLATLTRQPEKKKEVDKPAPAPKKEPSKKAYPEPIPGTSYPSERLRPEECSNYTEREKEIVIEALLKDPRYDNLKGRQILDQILALQEYEKDLERDFDLEQDLGSSFDEDDDMW